MRPCSKCVVTSSVNGQKMGLRLHGGVKFVIFFWVHQLVLFSLKLILVTDLNLCGSLF